jgi:threonine/homoserine/homoserine lactone efflux protein
MTAEFLVTSFLVALIPGTGVVYTVSSAIGGGWRPGLFAAVGCTLGILPHMAAAMLGLSGVMQTGATVFEAVRWAGVAYLVFIGLSMFRGGGAMSVTGAAGTSASTAAVVRRGILLNLLNPKLTLFFFAFLPQFLDADAGLLDARLIGLGGLFMLVTFVVFAGYAYVSAVFRDRMLSAPVAQRWVERTIGSLLIGFAAKLALSDR